MTFETAFLILKPQYDGDMEVLPWESEDLGSGWGIIICSTNFWLIIVKNKWDDIYKHSPQMS